MTGVVPPATGALGVVVHDDPSQRDLLADLLAREGFEVRAFGSAEAALTSLDRARPPDLIVTDLYMPGIDGWRFCRLLRSQENGSFNHVPILVVSATFSGDEAFRITADLGANAFVPCPVEEARFTETVRALLRGDRAERSLRALIVEDSRTLGALLKNAFRSAGYSPDLARSVGEADRAFRQAAYDVAVLDYHLPDGEGDRLLAAFREVSPDCVCVMMTTDLEPELALAWLRRGASAYVRKPFDVDYLLEICARSRRERSLLRVQDLLEVRTRELRKSQEEHRILLAESPDPVFSFSKEGRYLYVNKAFADGVGRPREEIVGSTLWDVFPKADADQRFSALRRVLETGEKETLEVRVLSDGAEHFYITTIIPTRDSEGRVSGAICSAKDVTDWKRGEEERERLHAQLNQAQKIEAVGRLAGGVAHDFNNMLGVILGHADLALMKLAPDQPLAGDLLEIREAAQRSAVLTGQLLAFARKQSVAPRVLDLNETVEGMLGLLRRLVGEEVPIAWRPGAGLWPVRIDPSQVDQLLANLCVNARDAIGGVGQITIETARAAFDAEYCLRHAGAAEGDYVLLCVSDDGCGMDRETQDRVFEPFFTTKEAGKGTGLGLATVYGIVKQNGGYINLYSEPGLGTTVKVYLPRHPGEADPVPGGTSEAAAPRGSETVLLVEDEPSILNLGRRILEGQGYRVLAAASPAEALRAAEELGGDLHLLVTDVVMPEMNGRQLAERLVALRPGLKVLFVSGYTSDVIGHRGVLDEGVHFLPKPYSVRDLTAKVREVLETPKSS